MALVLLSDHRTDAAARWAKRAVEVASTSFTRACSHSVLGACQALAGSGDRAKALLESELARCADTRSELMVRVGLGSVMLWTDDLDGAAAQLGTVAWREDVHGLPLPDLLVATLHNVITDYRRGSMGRGGHGRRETGVADRGSRPGVAALQRSCHRRVRQCRPGRAAAGGRARAGRCPSCPRAISIRADQPGERGSRPAFAADDPGGVLAAVQPVIGRLDQLASSRAHPARVLAQLRLGAGTAGPGSMTRNKHSVPSKTSRRPAAATPPWRPRPGSAAA